MTAFLIRNWVWIVFLVVFVLMHRAGYGCGMHGGHSGHGSHGEEGEHNHEPSDQQRRDDTTAPRWR